MVPGAILGLRVWQRNLTGHILVILFLFLFTSFRPVPTAQHSLTLGCSSSTGHSLPGACPLDPLVHMFNASSGTHVSSQFCYIFYCNLYTVPFWWIWLSCITGPVVLAEFHLLSRVTTPMAEDFWQIQKTVKRGFFKQYLRLWVVLNVLYFFIFKVVDWLMGNIWGTGKVIWYLTKFEETDWMPS